MNHALLLLAILAAAWLAVGMPRVVSRFAWTAVLYGYVDDALGSGRAATDWPLLWLFRRRSRPHLRTTITIPPLWRQLWYVRVHFRPKPWPRWFRRHDIIAVDCRPTSEANVHGKLWGAPYFDALGWKVAQALGLEWSADLFEVVRHRGRRGRFTGWVTYTVARRTPTPRVPDHVPAGEELGR